MFFGALLMVIFMAACDNPLAPGYPYKGTVKYLSFEGGFYGILAESGAEYDPLNLPAEFAVDGLRVKFDGKERPDKGSVHMWGIAFEITKIERL